MMELQKLEDYIKEFGVNYPDVSKDIIKKMATEIYEKMYQRFKEDTSKDMIPKGYVLASYLAQTLGLNSSYFTTAFRRGYELNVDMQKFGKYLYAKPSNDITELIGNKYICMKIEHGTRKEFDVCINLSKNCLLGFYK